MRPLLLAPFALMVGLVPATTWGQAGPPNPAPVPPPAQAPAPIRLPTIRIAGDEGRTDREHPAPVGDDADAVAAPPVSEFLVIPIRAHVLAAPDLAAVDCQLTDDDIRRVVGKVNAIYRPAGIFWALDPIVREPAARLARFRAAREAEPNDALGPFRLLAPDGSRSGRGFDVYYIHKFAVNGVYLGDRLAFVQETAKLRPVPGGIDEPLPRVTAHELGHGLGLPHRQDRTNLLASGTTGTLFNKAEVDRIRARAPEIPGTRTVPDLRRDRDAARAKKDDAEAARLDALLAAIEGAAPPTSTAPPPATAAP